MKPRDVIVHGRAVNPLDFDKMPIHWLPKGASWEEVMAAGEPYRQYYLKHFDSPEKRLKTKNPKPCVLD